MERQETIQLLQKLIAAEPSVGGQMLGDPKFKEALGMAAQVLLAEMQRQSARAQGATRSGAAWTADEEAKLKALFEQRKELFEIAKELQRSKTGVVARLVKLNLAREEDYPNYSLRYNSQQTANGSDTRS